MHAAVYDFDVGAITTMLEDHSISPDVMEPGDETNYTMLLTAVSIGGDQPVSANDRTHARTGVVCAPRFILHASKQAKSTHACPVTSIVSVRVSELLMLSRKIDGRGCVFCFLDGG